MPTEFTRLLAEITQGNNDGEAGLASLADCPLRHTAAACTNRERMGRALQTKVLVDEAYFQIVHREHKDRCSRSRFAVASQLR